MRSFRIMLSLSVILFSSLACNAVTGVRSAQTDVPALLTQVPTARGVIETAVAEFTPPVISTMPASDETPVAGTLGIKLDDVKTILQITQQFAFSEGTLDDKPASIAKLTSFAANTFPTLAAGFSVAFAGDPTNLSEIRVTIPRTTEQASIDEGLGLLGILSAGIFPGDVQVEFIQWISQHYASLAVGSSEEIEIQNLKFNLTRTETEMLLSVVPAY